MKTSANTDIKIVNMNVWFGLDARGYRKFGEYESESRRQQRFQMLCAGLQALDPDVIGIQEANKLPQYADKLAARLDYDTVWKITNSGVKILGFGIPVNFTAGNAVLAKQDYKLKYIGCRRLSGHGIQTRHLAVHFRELRDVMAARVVINGRPLIIFNTQTHYGLVWNKEGKQTLRDMFAKEAVTKQLQQEILAQVRKSHARRENEIVKLGHFVKKIQAVHHCPYVIMGDFNTSIDTPALSGLIRNLGLLDAYQLKNPDKPGYTWDPGRNTNAGFDGSPYWADGVTPRYPLSRLKAMYDNRIPRRIDFIFLSYQFKPDMIKNARRVFTKAKNNLYASDHFGVEVVLNSIPQTAEP